MSSVVISGNTSGTVTLAAPDAAGTTTLTLPAVSGDFVTTDGSGNATITGEMTAASFAGDGSGLTGLNINVNSKTTNGYQKLASGIIIQWGRANANTSGVTGSFPIAFPTACFSMVAVNNNQTNPPAPSTTINSASQFTLTVSAGGPNCNWLAIGY